MSQIISEKELPGEDLEIAAPDEVVLGNRFIAALANKDFNSLQQLFAPEVRFRAMVPSGERMGSTASEATAWLRKWFGSVDALQVLNSKAAMVADRLYLQYRLRVHETDGWKVIEQHAYGVVREEKIADFWLLCSGFRSVPVDKNDPGTVESPSSLSRLGGSIFYDAGAQGCAEGPMDEIARLMRQLVSGQTLEIHATDPSVARDLPAWCRLSGHSLEKQEEQNYLIRHS